MFFRNLLLLGVGVAFLWGSKGVSYAAELHTKNVIEKKDETPENENFEVPEEYLSWFKSLKKEMLDKGTPHIDLITLDIKMPKMDGLDFLAKVREKHRELPIIICTAYNNYRHEFSVWNADGYILKSGNLTEIKDKIKRLIG